MTDRELLELASKAAGIQVEEWIEVGVHSGFTVDHGIRPNGICWNPLTDDGDALRLAVKLQLLPVNFAIFDGKEKLLEVNCRDGSVLEPIGDDHFSATRRAIVRSAAEIGKAMS